MSKAAVGAVVRFKKKKGTKGERNRPGRQKRKAYRGQGRV
jgi:hypothetical protein